MRDALFIAMQITRIICENKGLWMLLCTLVPEGTGEREDLFLRAPIYKRPLNRFDSYRVVLYRPLYRNLSSISHLTPKH